MWLGAVVVEAMRWQVERVTWTAMGPLTSAIETALLLALDGVGIKRHHFLSVPELLLLFQMVSYSVSTVVVGAIMRGVMRVTGELPLTPTPPEVTPRGLATVVRGRVMKVSMRFLGDFGPSCLRAYSFAVTSLRLVDMANTATAIIARTLRRIRHDAEYNCKVLSTDEPEMPPSAQTQFFHDCWAGLVRFSLQEPA